MQTYDEEARKKIAKTAVRKVGNVAQNISSAEGGAGNIENPASVGAEGGGEFWTNVGKSFLKRDEGEGRAPTPGGGGRIPTGVNTTTALGTEADPFGLAKRTVGEVSPRTGPGSERYDPGRYPNDARMYIPSPPDKPGMSPGEIRNNMTQNMLKAGREHQGLGEGGSLDARNKYAQANFPLLSSQSKPLSSVASKAKDNLMKQRFGPDTALGGRDVYEMKDGERTGRILESSDWLKDGNAFSSNAWEKTVGGQPNQGYDPNAVQPAGYYNEAGTFIAGPRFKPADLEGMISRATKGLKDENAIAAVTSALSNAMSGITGVVPEGTGIGPEKERGLKERMAKIAAEASKATASITAAGGVQEAGIGAGADKYRSDTPYYQEDRSTPAKQQVVQIGEEPTETGGTRKIWGTPGQAVSGGDQGVSKDRVRVIQNQLRDLKGKDRDDYLDSLSPEEFNAVKGSR